MTQLLDTPHRPFRIIEFFCGIGGCAAAVDGMAEIVLAVDQNKHALATYAENFDHPTCRKTIQSVPLSLLRDTQAQLWWCSPPCQPFTIKGTRRDLDDPRTEGLLNLMSKLEAVQPKYFALENVPGFRSSKTHHLLRDTLIRSEYTHLIERDICPTEFGFPNRRPRFYLLASQAPLQGLTFGKKEFQPLHQFLDMIQDSSLDLDPDLKTRYASAIDVVDPNDPSVITRCFTASYGCSTVRSGSYVTRETGTIRLFSAREIANLLGFPSGFCFPQNLSNRQKWRLLGNSLSVTVVRHFLSQIPELQHLRDHL